MIKRYMLFMTASLKKAITCCFKLKIISEVNMQVHGKNLQLFQFQE
jgi:hypothetical protein